MNAVHDVRFCVKCLFGAVLADRQHHVNPLCEVNSDEAGQLVIDYRDLTEKYVDRFFHGVYAIFDDDYSDQTVLYVGMTSNIEQRLTQWFQGPEAPRINSWDPPPAYVMTVTVEDALVASELERRLIRYFDPLYNDHLRRTEEERRRERLSETEGVEWRKGKMYRYAQT